MTERTRGCVLVLLLFGSVAAVLAQQPTPRPAYWNAGQTNDPGHPLGSIMTNSTLTAAQVVDLLVGAGAGATVSNVTSNCNTGAFGSFSGAGGTLAFPSGIVLSSGNIASVPGPNVSDSITTGWGSAGDPDLNLISAPSTTTDACVIEFDLECAGAQNVTFNFQFASDEYNEFANTSFNDPFALYIGGVNKALLANLTPISINNVNGGNPYIDGVIGATNGDQYTSNDCSDPGGCPLDTEMDGLTLQQTATGALAGVTHIKLAIADAGDTAYDSNVFLEGGSLQCAATGACCSSGSCSISTQADCQGAYQGDGTVCGPDTCPDVPTTSEWGLLGMFLMLATALAIVMAFGSRTNRQRV